MGDFCGLILGNFWGGLRDMNCLFYVCFFMYVEALRYAFSYAYYIAFYIDICPINP